MPRYYSEWRSIEIPGFLLEPGWIDVSYHNDTCGSSFLPVRGEQIGIRVWVEHDRREDRDCPDSEKYGVEWLRSEDGWCDGTAKLLYAGESAGEAQEIILHFLAGFAAASIIADILDNYNGQIPRRCASFAELHDWCDANILGCAEDFAEKFGLDYSCDVLNIAQEEVTKWLEERSGRHVVGASGNE